MKLSNTVLNIVYEIVFVWVLGFGLPLILSFNWMTWLEKADNKFIFLRNYLIVTQLLLLVLIITEQDSYLNPSISIISIFIQNPSKYWHFYLYILTSISLVLLFWIPYGRTKNGARIATIIMFFNVPLGILGPWAILPRMGYQVPLDEVTKGICIFRLLFSISILVPQYAWSVVFGKLPSTFYVNKDGYQTNVYNDETLVGQLTKWIAESLKEMEEDFT